MEIPSPLLNGFTIYSKSGCSNCLKAKNLLKDNKGLFNIIDCDEYLIEDKAFFLSFMEEKIGYSIKVFPFVFQDSKFIGGFNETKKSVEKLLLSFENKF